MEDIKRDGFRILGQHFPYPKTWQATLGLACVCATIFGTFWLVLNAKPQNVKYLSNLLIESKYFDPDGTLSNSKANRYIQFWTPSAATQQFLKTSNGGFVPEDQKWQIVSDEKAKKFGDYIMDYQLVQGFRRYEVYGKGRSTYKKGWWWAARIEFDFDLSEFARSYSDFWGSNKTLYVEEINPEVQYVR